MWLAFAVGIAIVTFGMIFFASSTAVVSFFFFMSGFRLESDNMSVQFINAAYKVQYFGAMLFQKTSFFDSEDNSHGTLTSRITGDPKQLEELLGVNMALGLQA